MNKLLASGCSITHGLKTASNGYDINNTQHSYARLLADWLDVGYVNVAYPGASNELIFHRTVNQLINHHDYTHCVIGWTSLHRESWEKQNVVWSFNARYGQCSDNNINELPYIKKHPIAHICANRKELVKDVLRYWEACKIKLLNDSLEQKLDHYRTAIELICDQKNVSLIEVSALPNDVSVFKLYSVGTWLHESRHPTINEHQLIFQQLMDSIKRS